MNQRGKRLPPWPKESSDRYRETGKIAEAIFNHLAGALVSGMIHLSDRKGLYQALNGAGAMTSEELALKTGLNERWLREWLYQQAAPT